MSAERAPNDPTSHSNRSKEQLVQQLLNVAYCLGNQRPGTNLVYDLDRSRVQTEYEEGSVRIYIDMEDQTLSNEDTLIKSNGTNLIVVSECREETKGLLYELKTPFESLDEFSVQIRNGIVTVEIFGDYGGSI
ncbi:hypothetical protein ACFO0N_08520 [Halobium salinum]|uniref:Hsp20/alpha crystallin family protein n=1 Tax=Halobium salinum TaxID=1364940 RepID=A0ABD5PB97_9EURY|nr:hypothetical protein [Halobium salinum]